MPVATADSFIIRLVSPAAAADRYQTCRSPMTLAVLSAINILREIATRAVVVVAYIDRSGERTSRGDGAARSRARAAGPAMI